MATKKENSKKIDERLLNSMRASTTILEQKECKWQNSTFWFLVSESAGFWALESKLP
jgi:hypothetical protein